MKEELVEILEHLEHTMDTKEKIRILMNNKTNDDLRTLFYYVFNENIQFGIDIEDFRYEYITGESHFKCIFDLLDYLIMNNKTDDEFIVDEMNQYICNADEKAKYWIIKTILKDLDIDVTVDILNQVWENFI